MEIDRRAFLATLGTAAVVEAMPSEALADALEHHMMDTLDEQGAANNELIIRKGAGSIFGPGGMSSGVRTLKPLDQMPQKPTLVDFFTSRFAPATHVLQSATDAMKKGEKEETILACLLHDVVLSLIKVDHGWWGAQMMEPYVSEKVSWGIRYHQALRFYPDPSVGYEYPELYNRIFGKDYVPLPYSFSGAAPSSEASRRWCGCRKTPKTSQNAAAAISATISQRMAAARKSASTVGHCTLN